MNKKRRNLCVADARKPNLSREKFAGSGKVFYEVRGEFWTDHWSRAGMRLGLVTTGSLWLAGRNRVVENNFAPNMTPIWVAVQRTVQRHSRSEI